MCLCLPIPLCTFLYDLSILYHTSSDTINELKNGENDQSAIYSKPGQKGIKTIDRGRLTWIRGTRLGMYGQIMNADIT